jgi:hypothetical protein
MARTLDTLPSERTPWDETPKSSSSLTHLLDEAEQTLAPRPEPVLHLHPVTAAPPRPFAYDGTALHPSQCLSGTIRVVARAGRVGEGLRRVLPCSVLHDVCGPRRILAGQWRNGRPTVVHGEVVTGLVVESMHDLIQGQHGLHLARP